MNSVTPLAALDRSSYRPLAAPSTRVMKFGGSSVADPEGIARVARRLVGAAQSGVRVVGVVSAMGNTTDELVSLAHEVSPRPAPRELDMLLSVGEQISCALVAMAIAELDHESISLTGPQAGIVTDETHGNAKIVDIRARRIVAALESGRIVLVTGFQGLGGSEITTLGRGGSDATAVALAAALGAETCEIYTDVDGVFSADPRLVPDARKLRLVACEEMLELAAAGAAVLQLRSVELAQLHGVELHVRSSFEAAEGTRIVRKDTRFERPLVTGIGHSTSEALYRVVGADNADLFAALAGAALNVDTIIQLDSEIAFSTSIDDRLAVREVLEDLWVSWSERLDLGRITVVGSGMQTNPGIAAKTFAAVRDLGLTAQFISTSPIKISFYIPRERVEQAVQALHKLLQPGEPPRQPDTAA